MSINIKRISKDTKNTTFEISGSNMHFSIVNALRRVLLADVSSFAFDINTITIYKNTSKLNNDQLKHQISMIPILIDASKYPSLNMNCSFKNNTNDFIDVTTADAIFFNEDTELEEKYVDKFIINTLNKGEELNFKATINFEKANHNGNYLKCLAYYKEVSENKYSFTIESFCYQSTIELFKEACVLLIKKIQEFKENINFNLKETSNNDTKIHLEIIDENDTLGNIISSKLQRNPLIILASYKKQHPLRNKVDIFVSCKIGSNIYQCIIKSVDELLADIKILQNIK